MNSTITKENKPGFDEQILESKVPVIVDFWAEWCAPCHMLSPILEDVERELQDKVKIIKGQYAGQSGTIWGQATAGEFYQVKLDDSAWTVSIEEPSLAHA